LSYLLNREKRRGFYTPKWKFLWRGGGRKKKRPVFYSKGSPGEKGKKKVINRKKGQET